MAKGVPGGSPPVGKGAEAGEHAGLLLARELPGGADAVLDLIALRVASHGKALRVHEGMELGESLRYLGQPRRIPHGDFRERGAAEPLEDDPEPALHLHQLIGGGDRQAEIADCPSGAELALDRLATHPGEIQLEDAVISPGVDFGCPPGSDQLSLFHAMPDPSSATARSANSPSSKSPGRRDGRSGSGETRTPAPRAVLKKAS